MTHHTPGLTDPRHPQWRNGRITSTIGKEWKGYLTMTLLWNALAQPAFWLNAFHNPEVHGWKLAVLGMFPLIGLLLAWASAVKWLQWKRFGKLELAMDPFPAAPGGDAGGVVELPLAYRSGKTVDVTLSCVKVTIRHSSKGDSRNERVLWRDRASVTVEPGVQGSRVRFRFAIPADLPTTSERSNNAIMWVVRLQRKLPGADLDQVFELPVLDSDKPLSSRHIRHYSNETPTQDASPMGGILLEQSAGELSLHYPASRGRGMGFMLLVFGLVFSLVPGFLIFNASATAGGSAFDTLFFSFGAFFTLVFGAVSLLLILSGLYTLLNRLDIRIDADRILSTRRILGLCFRRTLLRANIQHLRYRITAQQGQGARASVHYRLEAVPVSGKPLCLGDGIKGRPQARTLMQALGLALHIDDWQEYASRARARQPD